MANIDADWPIEGLLTPQESVEKMLAVIPDKTIDDTGTFWTWEGKVSIEPFHLTGWFSSSTYPFPVLRADVPIDSSTHNVSFSVQTITDKAFCRYIRGDNVLASPFFRTQSSLEIDGKDSLEGCLRTQHAYTAQHTLVARGHSLKVGGNKEPAYITFESFKPGCTRSKCRKANLFLISENDSLSKLDLAAVSYLAGLRDQAVAIQVHATMPAHSCQPMQRAVSSNVTVASACLVANLKRLAFRYAL
jgi:hypothetical protein